MTAVHVVVAAVPPALIADALDAHAATLEWEDRDGPASGVAADLRRIAGDIRATQPFTPGDRVSWLHVPGHRRAGIVAELDTNTTIAVMPDDDPRSLIYLDTRHLTNHTKGV